MLGRRTLLGSVLVGALLAGGLLFGEQQPPPSKSKGKLPPYWSKLGLSEEQRKKASTIMAEYKDKIDVLKRDISKLEDEEKRELSRILTDPQREELRKIFAAKVLSDPPPDGKAKDASKPKEQKKPGDK